jgi:hypothetical protein
MFLSLFGIGAHMGHHSVVSIQAVQMSDVIGGYCPDTNGMELH